MDLDALMECVLDNTRKLLELIPVTTFRVKHIMVLK